MLPGRMQPLSKSWYYWVIVVLLVMQVLLSVNYHVLVCNMPIANTLMLLIIMAHHGYALGNQARPLFYRICGCVTFIAVLFVNTTHALEMLTDTEEGGHSHGGDNEHEDHDDHVHNHGFVPKPYVVVSLVDVAVKSLVLVLGHVPDMGLHPILRLVLHTLSPLTVIAFYGAGLAIPDSVGESWIWKHIDPIAAVLMTLLFIGLILPAFKEMMPYIFADTPEKFKEEKFKEEISATTTQDGEKFQFNDVTCPHIHAYRLWPGNLFEALLHVDILVDKSNPDWSSKAAQRYDDVYKNVSSALTKAGAQKVFVEPKFVDVNDGPSEWVGCVGDTCFKRDKGCCDTGNSSPSETHV